MFVAIAACLDSYDLFMATSGERISLHTYKTHAIVANTMQLGAKFMTGLRGWKGSWPFREAFFNGHWIIH